MYRRGVDTPTLAEIARAAGVPPGNVFYYFRTRDDLVAAVVDSRVEGIRGLLIALDEIPDPKARLKALTKVWSDNRDDIATYGCPMGTLCSELTKRVSGDYGAAVIFSTAADWITSQFRQLGQPDAPEDAMTLLATVQGAAVLAATLREPTILMNLIRRLEQWIDSLPTTKRSTTNGDKQ